MGRLLGRALAGIAVACPAPATAAVCQTVYVSGVGLQPVVQCLPFPPGEPVACQTKVQQLTPQIAAEVTVCVPGRD